MAILQISYFSGKLVSKTSFFLTRSCTEVHCDPWLWVFSSVANVLHEKKSLLDEEIDFEEHKTNLAFVVTVLGNGSSGGKWETQGKVVSMGRSMEKPRHQESPEEAEKWCWISLRRQINFGRRDVHNLAWWLSGEQWCFWTFESPENSSCEAVRSGGGS